jgi:ABC-type glycerol-3-phosphate transport system permease component
MHRLVVAAFAVVLSFPFYWMALTSFKRTSDLYELKNNPLLFNESPTLAHSSSREPSFRGGSPTLSPWAWRSSRSRSCSRCPRPTRSRA